MNKINSMRELTRLARAEDGCECYILLTVGKSSKKITLINGEFHVINEIDDSSEILSAAELKQSNIGDAMKKGTLIAY